LPRALELRNNAAVQATGIVSFGTSTGKTIQKIPTNGHPHYSLTSTKTGANAGEGAAYSRSTQK
jgi:hypothetical protein